MVSYELMMTWMGDMNAKREAIIRNAAKIEAQANENGFAYAPVCKLYETINVIMRWSDTERVKQTVQNMASKGIIEISKSGKGFKLCK